MITFEVMQPDIKVKTHNFVSIPGPSFVQDPFSAPLTRIKSGYCTTYILRILVDLINMYRDDKGLYLLRPSKKLGSAAQFHSDDMAANDYVAHTLSDGTTAGDNMRNHGYDYNTWLGENLAAGQPTPQEVVDAWKASMAGHNETMLSEHFRAVGIGYAHNPDTRYHHYWTACFGGVLNKAAPKCQER